MKKLLPALALVMAPAVAWAQPKAPPPPPRPPAASLATPVMFCRVEGISHVAVCYDHRGKKSWIV